MTTLPRGDTRLDSQPQHGPDLHVATTLDLPDMSAPAAEGANLQIRLLGSVDVVLDGTVRDVPGVRRKAALAALALRIGHPVSNDFLIDVVWSGDTPSTVVNTLQSHMSYLRRILRRPGCIVASSPGYRLDQRRVDTDLRAAERLIQSAEQTTDLREKATRLQAALDLWRGKPLDEIGGQPWIDEQCERIERLHYETAKSLIETRLALGEHSALIGTVEEMIEHHPFDEDLCSQLMTALYRSGRQADALAAYRELRIRLNDELGITPGRRLRDLEQAVLRQDPTLDAPSKRSVPVITAASQLPPAATRLVGRQQEIEQLERILDRSHRQPLGTAAPVIAVSGAPGIGKTTLALHWAHGILPSFPDGHLFIDLQGFDPAHPPLTPTQALQSLISTLGHPSDHIPDELNALAGLYRTLLNGKKVLLLLDNARNADQIRPLLPSTPDSLAIVTSRNDLTSLAITNGAQLLRVGPLSTTAGVELLSGKQHHPLAHNHRPAAEHIVKICGGVPLALAIVAARHHTHPHEQLPQVAAQMSSPGAAFNMLLTDDLSVNLWASYNTSYQRLTSTTQQVLRQLTASDSSEAGGTVRLSASVPAPVHRALSELTRASLIEQTAANSFVLSPLFRAYAAQLGGEDSESILKEPA
ncbi:BTAD domain-containing putative transcriptional regulator [Kribbella sp. NPDC004536]|uniref:AfsR/SARP family transcriptional regulator n=1 Tax=Kribbella sp. NPDC004536 TaxID=3364106 RepID=UPI0036B8613A